MAMAAAGEVESLAAYMQGRLSIKHFECPQPHRPTLPFNSYLHSHLIPEIDLQALALPCTSTNGSTDLGTGTHTQPGSQSPNSDAVDVACVGIGVDRRYQSPDSEQGHHQHELLLKAATTCGFFQVHNHPIPLSALETLNSYACKFFSMPLDRKLEAAKVLGNLIAGNFSSGYMCGSPLDSPNKYWFEALRVASSNKSNILAVAQCLWSEEVDQKAFSDALEECSNGFTKLSEQLTTILLRALGVDADDVLNEFVKGEEIAGLKFNHYPACPQPDTTLGLPAHTDVSLLTLLWQDEVGGLQVQRDGQWITVKPRHDALVVNIGDIFQVWSNDRFQSGVHRPVLNETQSRYSIAYFYNPRGDSMLAPLQQLLRSGQPPKFKTILTSDYRRHVFACIYQDQWEGVEYLRLYDSTQSQPSLGSDCANEHTK